MDFAVAIPVGVFLAYYWTGFGMVEFHRMLNPVDQPAYVHAPAWQQVLAGAFWPYVARLNGEFVWNVVCFLSSAVVATLAYSLLLHLINSSFFAIIILSGVRAIPVLHVVVSGPTALIAALLWFLFAKPFGLKPPSGIERVELLRRIDGGAGESSDDERRDTEDDAEELDDIDCRAQKYHDQIDAQIESSYKFLRDMFGEENGENPARRYSLRTLSVFAVHIATLVAVKREFPKLHRSTLNGFTRTLSFRTPNTMPNVKPPDGVFVSYCSEEESFMHTQTEVFDQQGVEPLVRSLLQQLGGKDGDYKSLSEHLERAARQASRTYLPFLAEE